MRHNIYEGKDSVIPCEGFDRQVYLVGKYLIKKYSRTSMARTSLGPCNLFEIWIVRATEG